MTMSSLEDCKTVVENLDGRVSGYFNFLSLIDVEYYKIFLKLSLYEALTLKRDLLISGVWWQNLKGEFLRQA